MQEDVAQVVTQVLDHHGLVAAKCRELRLSERIDERVGSHPGRIVSHGTACVAMIVNGLGFTNRRLYLTPQFFESKPLEALLGPGIEARHLNDDALGDALDAIARYGPSKLFAQVAFEIALEHKLLDQLVHVDTTSFSVHGDGYEDKSGTHSTEPLRVTHGYSKDHRPDLKQVVLSLAVAGGSGVPLWMSPCDGNASDKKVLPESIERIEAFRRQIDCTNRLRWVADSALYTAQNLDKMRDTVWVSRVPESIQAARELASKPEQDIAWQAHEDGYKIAAFAADYAQIEQRWLLVFSAQAYAREAKTFQARLDKQERALEQGLRQFGTQLFACEADALSALERHRKDHPLFVLSGSAEPVLRYDKPGRPKPGDTQRCVGYRVTVQMRRNDEAIARQLQAKGRFILATNDLDHSAYPDSHLLADYKAQQSVEQGFRFLKNPEFLADTLYLKSPERIGALTMVMTLCLLVYNLAQFQVRNALQQSGQTLPNQLGKPIKTPTLRWIFQLMEGIATVQMPQHYAVSNLNSLRIQIVRLFGPTACRIYRVCADGGGM